MKNLIEQLNIVDFQTHFQADAKADSKADAPTFSASMVMTDFHAQPQGFLNGGATLAFAEVIAGMASNALLIAAAGNSADSANTDTSDISNQVAVGKSVTAHHLTATRATGQLHAQGELLRQSPHSHIWQLRFHDDQGNFISTVIIENAIIRK